MTSYETGYPSVRDSYRVTIEDAHSKEKGTSPLLLAKHITELGPYFSFAFIVLEGNRDLLLHVEDSLGKKESTVTILSSTVFKL